MSPASRAGSRSRSISSRGDLVEPHPLVEVAARLQAGKVEQIRHDALQAHRFAFQLLGEAAHGRRVVGRGVADRLGGRADRGHGGLQLVARVRDEVASDGVEAPRLRHVPHHDEDRAVVADGQCGHPQPAGRAPDLHLDVGGRARVAGALGGALELERAGGRRRRPACPRGAALRASFAKTRPPVAPSRSTPSSMEPRIRSWVRRSSSESWRWVARAIFAASADPSAAAQRSRVRSRSATQADDGDDRRCRSERDRGSHDPGV